MFQVLILSSFPKTFERSQWLMKTKNSVTFSNIKDVKHWQSKTESFFLSQKVGDNDHQRADQYSDTESDYIAQSAQNEPGKRLLSMSYESTW